MPKIVALLQRAEDTTHEEFATYWRDQHVPLVKQLPGLVRYTTATPADPAAAPYDGIAEAYFESEEAIDEAFRTDLGQRIREDERHFVGTVDYFVATESVEVDGPIPDSA